jgi:hypothetical protein
MARAIRALIDTLFVLAVVGLVTSAWIVRDELNPDSATSSSLEAVSRCFMTFHSGPG